MYGTRYFPLDHLDEKVQSALDSLQVDGSLRQHCDRLLLLTDDVDGGSQGGGGSKGRNQFFGDLIPILILFAITSTVGNFPN
jgi:hypothetical protein